MQRKVNVEIHHISYLNLFKVFFAVLISVYILLNLTQKASSSSVMFASLILIILSSIQILLIAIQTLLELIKYIRSLMDFYIPVPFLKIKQVSYNINYKNVVLPNIKSTILLSVIRI